MIDLLKPFRSNAGAAAKDAPHAGGTASAASSTGRGRIVVVANEKGGSGKSTMAMHLAIAMLKDGLRVATMDLDIRQGTLSHYVGNRRRYAEAAHARPVMPEHFDGDAIVGPKDTGPETSAERLRYLLDGGRANFDVVIVDTPGSDTPLGREAHVAADLVLTPVNDSFVDLDVLAQIDAQKKTVVGPSPFSTLLMTDRNERRQSGRPAAPWLVARNRLGTLESHNTRDVDWALEQLQKALGIAVIPGFSERVIFRELFLVGLTILDLKDAAGGKPLSRSHVAARNEVTALAAAVGRALGGSIDKTG